MNERNTQNIGATIPRNIMGIGSIHVRFLSGFLKDGFKLRNLGEAVLYGAIAGIIWNGATGFFDIPPIVAGSCFMAFVLAPALVCLKGIYGGKPVIYMIGLYMQNRKNSREVYRLRLPGIRK